LNSTASGQAQWWAIVNRLMTLRLH
jgi:hypothetical protein